MAPRPNKKRKNQSVSDSDGYDLARGSLSRKRKIPSLQRDYTPVVKRRSSKGTTANNKHSKLSESKKRPPTSKSRSSKLSKNRKGANKKGKSRSFNYNDRFLVLQGRKRKRCRPPGTFADYVRDYWKAKKKANKDYNKTIAEACRDAAKCWRKLTAVQRRYYQMRYCGQYQKMKKSGTFCARRYPRKKNKKARSHKK